MDGEWFEEIDLSDLEAIICDECGNAIDVSVATSPDEVAQHISSHCIEEHGWGTDEAGLRYATQQFGELGLEYRDELESLSVEDYEIDIYDDQWGAAISHEVSKFTDEFRLSVGMVNTDDILERGSHAPTQFRQELVDVVEEAITRGATVMLLDEQFSTLTGLLAQQNTESVLEWATKGGDYRQSKS